MNTQPAMITDVPAFAVSAEFVVYNTIIAIGPEYDRGISKSRRVMRLILLFELVVYRPKTVIAKSKKKVQIETTNIGISIESLSSIETFIPRAQITTRKTKSNLTSVLNKFASKAIL